MDVSGKARPRSGGGASERVAAPEGATHVVGRQLVQVGVSLSRPHFDEDVVAGVLARDVQPVRVEGDDVVLRFRFVGEFVEVMELQEFPFDVQACGASDARIAGAWRLFLVFLAG